MSDKSQIEKLSFEAWWNKKGFNSVLLRVAAWEAWMARAESQQQDPNEWVVQDRVPPRKNIDQICWGSGDWHSDWHKEWQFGKAMHGYYPRFGGQLNVRCRRKDLPPTEIQPRTTEEINAEYHAAQAALKSKNPEPEPQPIKRRVRLWVSQSAVIVRDANSKGFGKEIHHDSEGFYIEE